MRSVEWGVGKLVSVLSIRLVELQQRLCGQVCRQRRRIPWQLLDDEPSQRLQRKLDDGVPHLLRPLLRAQPFRIHLWRRHRPAHPVGQWRNVLQRSAVSSGAVTSHHTTAAVAAVAAAVAVAATVAALHHTNSKLASKLLLRPLV